MGSIGAAGPTNLAVTPEPRRDPTLLSPEGGYGNANAGRELSLSLLWSVAVEWRWLILAAIGTGLTAAVLITLLTPLKYRSTASLQLNPPSVEVLTNDKDSRQSVNSGDANFIGTQLGLLGSEAVAERVAQDLNLANNPEVVGSGTDRAVNTKIATEFVQGGTKVKLQPQSSLVDVSFSARDPQLAAQVVNGIADAYITTNLERSYQSSSYARDFLQRQIATTRRDLEKSERQLVAYAQQQRLITTGGSGTGADQGSDTNSLTGSSLVALNAALAQTQAKRIAAEQRYREAVSGGSTTETSANAAPLRAQIAGLEAQYQQKLQTFRPDYPEMAALRAQIDALKASVRTETRTASADRAGSLRQEFEASRAEEGRLRQQVNELSSSVLTQRGQRIRYNILQRDVDTNRTLYDALLQRYKEIGVAGGIGTAVASVVDRGDVPGGAYSPNLYLNLGIGFLLGLILGMLAALALEFINDTIKNPEDVRNKLHLPFLGGVPQAKAAKPIDELKDALSPVAEAYLSTATALQFVTEGGAPKTLLVTSTRPAEGKSTSALALAQAFTRLGKTVLLIEADMRRPVFVTGRDEIGLSHILTNESALSEHVLRTDVENFWILPAGRIPPSPPELIASARFAALIADASTTFDHVVIDGPPVLGLADSPLLSSVVQSTLMVVEAGRTRTRAAVEAQNRLRTAGARMIGAILTRYQAQAAYGYGYGYGQSKDQYRYVADANDNKRRILLAVENAE